MRLRLGFYHERYRRKNISKRLLRKGTAGYSPSMRRDVSEGVLWNDTDKENTKMHRSCKERCVFVITLDTTLLFV